MKILHGHVGTEVRVRVIDENATVENPRGYEVAEHVEPDGCPGFYATHGDSTFSVDPDGTLYVSGDMSKPAHHTYGCDTWYWVGDENNNGAFNTLHVPPS